MQVQYIALLRGINVGGHQVKMERLRAIFAELGFADVRSYIQTGNVFFASETADRELLRARIESGLERALGWAVPTCLRTTDELAAMVARDPFAGIDLTPDRRFAVTFFPTPHGLDPPLPYRTPQGGYELVAVTPLELFVVWHLQAGRPASDSSALDRKAASTGTTRFWHTTAKILAAAQRTDS